MTSRRAALALLALGATSARAQSSVTTGGGQARLDQQSISTVMSFNAKYADQLGPLDLRFDVTNITHSGLGTVALFDADLFWRDNPGPWRFTIGPTIRVAHDIGEEVTRGLGLMGRAAREFGPVTVDAGWQEGYAFTMSQRTGWSRQDLSGTLYIGNVNLGALWRGMTLRDSVPRNTTFVGSDPLNRPRVRGIHDLGLAAGWTGGAFTVNLQGGKRLVTDHRSSGWWQGDIAFRILPIVSLVLNAGSLPPDPLFSLRGTEFATFGLRLNETLAASRARLWPRNGAAVDVARHSPIRVRLRIILPEETRTAVLVGEPTGWKPVALKRTHDGRWETWLNVPVGLYRINVRLDGGPEMVPNGIAEISDGFGGKVGVVVL